jgi:AraC family transcriptional regulator
MDYYFEMQKSIDFIERNLKQDITLETLSEQAHFSVSHFYRLFQIYVGCSVMDYIRVRRLTNAAHDLLTTDKRVIDIALDYQFQSQEAFLRAFSKVFGITPGRYRKVKKDVSMFDKIDLSKTNYIFGKEIMKPQFVNKPFKLLGIESKINLNIDFENSIKYLQQKLFSELMQIKSSMISNSYVGFWYYKLNDGITNEEPSIWYLASVEVSNIDEVPRGLIIKSIQESKYAVFDEKKRGEVAGMEGYAYKVWLPSSGYSLNENIVGDFEVFPNKFDISPNSPCKIYIPIK